jgi:hypothetical protein
MDGLMNSSTKLEVSNTDLTGHKRCITSSGFGRSD